MTLTNIPIDLQNLLILDYEFRVKTIILVGWFIFALVYVLYWYKNQKPTKYFLVGTFRATLYIMSFFWSWLFFLLYPVMIHPNVSIDNLLIFLGTTYTVLSSIFLIMFIFNFTLWIPKMIIKFGKFDITGWEDNAIKEYFGDIKIFNGWWKR